MNIKGARPISDGSIASIYEVMRSKYGELCTLGSPIYAEGNVVLKTKRATLGLINSSRIS